MAISINNIQSDIQYAKSEQTSRKITLLENQADVAPQPAPASEVTLRKALYVESETQTHQFELNSLPPNLSQAKLILEKYFNHQFSLFNVKNMDEDNPPNKTIPANNQIIENPQTIEIDGTQYFSDAQLNVIEHHSREQSLAFNYSATIDINNQSHNVNYQFMLSQKQNSTSAMNVSAIQLKDPLLVQFGSKPLGGLNGQYVDIDINQDNQTDKLPLFSGDVGYLVFDRNNNGIVDNGSELFGPQTGNGFGELKQLDSNGNNLIDPDDEHYEQLFIWQPNEDSFDLTPLTSTDIHSISLNKIVTPFEFYDNENQLKARLTSSSIAVTENGQARGVHQIDIKI